MTQFYTWQKGFSHREDRHPIESQRELAPVTLHVPTLSLI